MYVCIYMHVCCVCTSQHDTRSVSQYKGWSADGSLPSASPTYVFTTHVPTHTNNPTEQLKQLAREAFTLAVTDLLGLLNAALAQVGSLEGDNGVGVLSLLSIPAPTLSNNVGPHTRVPVTSAHRPKQTHITCIPL